MRAVLKAVKIGPAVTVQDSGWNGTLATGLSRGGAVDTFALAQVSALLGQSGTAVLEMAGIGGTFHVMADARVALAGAVMDARLDGAALYWNAVHRLQKGQVLEIGAVRSGVYGYLGIGGGFATPRFLESASTHRGAGLGHVIQAGDVLHAHGDDNEERVGLALPKSAVVSTPIRVVPTAHTDLFDAETRACFERTVFTRGTRGNRQGVSLESDESFALQGGQSLTSETVIPGDIQVPGQGAPYALLADSQTTGGYPRIAAILPCDLPRIAQAEVGQSLRFKFITREEGIAVELADRKARARLANACAPIYRDPFHMTDLLSYQLISGAISGDLE